MGLINVFGQRLPVAGPESDQAVKAPHANYILSGQKKTDYRFPSITAGLVNTTRK